MRDEHRFRTTDDSPRTLVRRRRRVPLLVIWIAVASIAGACSAGPTVVPDLPTSLPTSLPTGLPTGGTACLDATTMGVISQLQAPDADAEAILAANRNALLRGLQAFQPPDEVTAQWRDTVVASLEAGDLTTAATTISGMTSAGITLTTC